jgi:hypothetical protein
MDPVDAIGMALTPGTVFNQQNKVFRSAKALAQFANVDQGEVLSLVAENLAERVTIRPSAKRPENGPLIALTEFIPDQPEHAVQVKIVGGNAVPVVIDQEALAGAEALMKKVEEIAENGDANDLAEALGALDAALEEDEYPIKVSEGDKLVNCFVGEPEMVGINDPDDEEVA